MNTSKKNHMLRLFSLTYGSRLYMSDEWIIDVLTDLKAYAVKNGLSVTADQLDDARLIAMTEIASASRRTTENVKPYDKPVGRPTLYIAGGEHA